MERFLEMAIADISRLIMTDSTKCPICGRNDIPDYNKGVVRCPDCGSDLKVFRLLNEIEEGSGMTSAKWKPLAILALAAAALFALLYFTKNPEASAAEAKERVALLEDSINALNERISNPVAAAAETTTATADNTKPQTTDEVKPAAAEEGQAQATETITAPADKVTVKDGKKYYTVKKGDSWWGISQKLYKGKVKDEEIARMNGMKPSEHLEIGQQILVK